MAEAVMEHKTQSERDSGVADRLVTILACFRALEEVEPNWGGPGDIHQALQADLSKLYMVIAEYKPLIESDLNRLNASRVAAASNEILRNGVSERVKQIREFVNDI